MLRRQVLQELRRAVSFDAYAWVLTDPETEVGTSPLADVPWFDQLPRQILLKYLTPLNRWTTLLDHPVALLQQSAAGDLRQSLVWRELLHEHGVVDVASVDPRPQSRLESIILRGPRQPHEPGVPAARARNGHAFGRRNRV